MQPIFKKSIPHLIAILVFIIGTALYTSPAFQGKKLIQHDQLQAMAGSQELRKYHDETGIWASWTNSMFGGMPSYMIAQGYPNSISTKMGSALNTFLPSPSNVIFLQMLGMYILLLVLGCNSWLGVIGGFIYGFGCYTMIFIEAGHISKILATAYAPIVLAGVVLCMKGRYWLGAAVLALSMGLELYANHIQITYFLAIVILIYVIWESIELLQQKKITHLFKAYLFMTIAALIGGLTQTTRLWAASELSKESTRGQSELTISADTTKKIEKANSGLDRDYSFIYSHGVLESLTLLIPNFAGGSSNGNLSANSDTYKAMIEAGVEPSQALDFVQKAAPTYWGDLPGTSGPAYAGAIVLFLFVLCFFIVKGDFKWFLLVVCTFFLALSWGKYFSLFNYLMFDYFPLFNKFRDNKMTMIMMEMFLGIGAMLSIKTIVSEKMTFAQLKKPLYYALGLTVGLALILGLGSSLFFDLKAASDSNLDQMIGNKELASSLQRTLTTDRATLLRNDAFRSSLFILLAAGFIALYVWGKIKVNVFYISIGLLIFLDLFLINKRSFNNDDYVAKAVANEQFIPSQADEMILKDTDIHYRVGDFTGNFWSEAKPSYYHKSISGYHGAKLKRTQELFDFQISKNNMEIFNMMNVKYFISADEKGNPTPQTNPNAKGNAWFVKEFKIVANANEEIKALDKFDSKQIAFIDKRFESQVKDLKIQYDSTNAIKLTGYKPNIMTYESNAKTTQLALFSEIFYRGNLDWKATIDGKYADHLRTDYVLRGLVIPSGKHQIVFTFAPNAISQGNKIDMGASILLLLLLGMAIFMEIKKPKESVL